MLSTKYKNWKSVLSPTTCKQCEELHGKIYLMDEYITPQPPPLHPNCKCVVVAIKAIYAGNATNQENKGADLWLKYYGVLPDYYISESEAKVLGYKRKKGNLAEVAPGKMITRGIYMNDDGHLPSKPGRIWYEADINYSFGYRGTDRILYSNDGLIFVTYDHYKTFCEIV